MDNLEKMEKFLEKYKLPTLNQKEIEHLNRPITSMEVKTIMKNLPPAKKKKAQMDSQVNSIKHFEKS